MAKMKFKDWYMQRHGVDVFPGRPGDVIETSMRQIAEAMAEWCDLVAEGKIPEQPTGTNHRD